MKKIIALIIAGLMVLSFAACGEKEDASSTDESNSVSETGSEKDVEAGSEDGSEDGSEAGSEDGSETTTDAEGSDIGESTATKVEGSVAAAYVAAFKEIAADDTLSAYEVAEKFATAIEAPMMLMATDMTEMMADDEMYFQGLGEFKPEGYEEVAHYAPMMGSIPFISYVFKLSADTDAEAFAASLEDNADPRWQICVTADETEVVVEGSFVFLIMAPAEFSYETPDFEELA